MPSQVRKIYPLLCNLDMLLGFKRENLTHTWSTYHCPIAQGNNEELHFLEDHWWDEDRHPTRGVGSLCLPDEAQQHRTLDSQATLRSRNLGESFR